MTITGVWFGAATIQVLYHRIFQISLHVEKLISLNIDEVTMISQHYFFKRFWGNFSTLAPLLAMV